jgi:copper chaperone NosL
VTRRALVVGPLASLAAVAVAVGALGLLDRPPAGPVEPAWDRDHCAHCRMAVSDPHFAAEIQTDDGRVLFFDDPGCLLAYERAHAGTSPKERAVYFHHAREARWLPRSAAGFLRGADTPMNWGYTAVAAGEPGAVPADAVVLSPTPEARHGAS